MWPAKKTSLSYVVLQVNQPLDEAESMTALDCAIWKGKCEVADVLLAKGADALKRLQQRNGRPSETTPLDLALRLSNRGCSAENSANFLQNCDCCSRVTD